jgi:RNA polymerase sigma-70 factor (ECF subfamily)
LRDQLIGLLPRLRRFAYSLTRDSDACNDLVQETCARALSKADLWQAGTRLDSWLFRIAQNLWLDRRRAESARGDHVDVDEIPTLAGTDGRKVTESRLALEEVTRGIAHLKPDHQIIIGLVCVDGMSYKEAAEVLELPIGTVMSRLSRARLELHDILENGGGHAPGARTEARRG